MIQNANKIPLSASGSTLPNMAECLLDQFQKITFIRIVKSVVQYDETEERTAFNFMGLVVPQNKSLQMKAEGQRTWDGIVVYAMATMILENDEVIEYAGLKYRVINSTNWSRFGFLEYNLTEDFR